MINKKKEEKGQDKSPCQPLKLCRAEISAELSGHGCVSREEKRKEKDRKVKIKGGRNRRKDHLRRNGSSIISYCIAIEYWDLKLTLLDLILSIIFLCSLLRRFNIKLERKKKIHNITCLNLLFLQISLYNICGFSVHFGLL